MGEKPEVLVVGPCRAWDPGPLGASCRLQRSSDAPDRATSLRACTEGRAGTTRRGRGGFGPVRHDLAAHLAVRPLPTPAL